MQEAPGDLMEMFRRFGHRQEGTAPGSPVRRPRQHVNLSLSRPLRHISMPKMEELGVIQICSTLVITKVPYHSTNPEPRPDPLIS